VALTDVPTAARAINATGIDSWLTVLVSAACKVVEAYCKRNLETAAFVEYLNGSGTPELVLRQRPIRTETLTGTLNSTTAVTGLSDTDFLAAGMRVTGTGIPDDTTIAAVVSATAITLSAAATASGSASLTFGHSLWYDPRGYYGKVSGSFAASTLLTVGRDYVLRYAADGTCQSGLALRLGGVLGASAGDLGGWTWPQSWGRGSLAATAPAVWPLGAGNVRAVYAAGYGVGPRESGGTLPEDLTMAANEVVAWMRRNLPLGGLLSSEGLGAYHYSVVLPQLSSLPELGSVRQILSRYREISV
jgi:hypothetical protein